RIGKKKKDSNISCLVKRSHKSIWWEHIISLDLNGPLIRYETKCRQSQKIREDIIYIYVLLIHAGCSKKISLSGYRYTERKISLQPPVPEDGSSSNLIALYIFFLSLL
ncbi:hypothetical protein V1477_018536, partial [Vespula maculifrons]